MIADIFGCAPIGRVSSRQKAAVVQEIENTAVAKIWRHLVERRDRQHKISPREYLRYLAVVYAVCPEVFEGLLPFEVADRLGVDHGEFYRARQHAARLLDPRTVLSPRAPRGGL